MDKGNWIITSHINDIKHYITLLRNSVMAYKKDNSRTHLTEALFYARKIIKLIMKIYLSK